MEPSTADAGTRPAPLPVWDQVLEELLACPACRARKVSVAPEPHCLQCGWQGKRSRDIVDFVEDAALNEHHHAELRAQGNAVNTYYENERKLSCHWDRISSDELPRLLDWTTGKVLDLGCGTGTAGAALRASGATVVGVDLSLDCLSVARRRLDAVVRADVARLPFGDEVFDAIIARGALHHLSDPGAALAEARRVVKPGGHALFLDPREFMWLEPIKDVIRKFDDSFSDDHHAYGVHAYRELISSAFEVEEVRTEHPLAILLLAGIDLVSLPGPLPHRLLASGLYRIDQALNRTPLRAGGHLIVVKARRR